MDPLRENLEHLAGRILEGRGFCPQCGVVSIDEDGCCAECGADASGLYLDELATNIQMICRRVAELEGGLAVAQARIKVLELQAQSRWTPTSESLPSDGSKCLIATEEGICIASHVHSGMFFSHGHRERPSRWMLLPQGPN